MRPNPFVQRADALAAHARMPRGQVYVNLTDDPETREEAAAEAQRKRIAEWHRRQKIAASLKKADDMR